MWWNNVANVNTTDDCYLWKWRFILIGTILIMSRNEEVVLTSYKRLPEEDKDQIQEQVPDSESFKKVSSNVSFFSKLDPRRYKTRKYSVAEVSCDDEKKRKQRNSGIFCFILLALMLGSFLCYISYLSILALPTLLGPFLVILYIAWYDIEGNE